jgi:hypothetical protein
MGQMPPNTGLPLPEYHTDAINAINEVCAVFG